MDELQAELTEEMRNAKKTLRKAHQAGTEIIYAPQVDIPEGNIKDASAIAQCLAIFGTASQAFVMQAEGNWAKGERAFVALYRDMIEHRGAFVSFEVAPGCSSSPRPRVQPCHVQHFHRDAPTVHISMLD